ERSPFESTLIRSDAAASIWAISRMPIHNTMDFFFSSRRRHTKSVSAFLLNRSSDLAKEWNNSLKTKLSLLPKKLFRIRMSRNFGMKMLTMTNLSTECLIQLTKLGYDATPFNQILKQNAKREMRLR